MAEIVGLDELLASLEQLEREAEDPREANLEAAELLVRSARTRINSVSGRLAASGRAIEDDGDGVAEFGGGSIRWAAPVHGGSYDRPQGGFVAPNPYLDDAADAEDTQIGEIYDDHLERVLDRLNL